MSYTGLVQPAAMTSLEEVIDDTTPLINKVYSSDKVQNEIDAIETAGAISDYTTSAVDLTVTAPTGRNISVLDYTGATGTITLPASAEMTIGGRVLIKKRNATMGSVNINKDGTDAVQWGSAQLRLYSDGDYWLLMWDGSRWCLLDGYETGSNANGSWLRNVGNRMYCTTALPTINLSTAAVEFASNWPVQFSEIIAQNYKAVITGSPARALPYGSMYNIPTNSQAIVGVGATISDLVVGGFTATGYGKWY